ncbi:hypothetical protein C8R43DRAFT_943515 [Mycena crocata]|nr:hypothetical protein C8R43DRAFT_943515 [Mycena crocata]
MDPRHKQRELLANPDFKPAWRKTARGKITSCFRTLGDRGLIQLSSLRVSDHGCSHKVILRRLRKCAARFRNHDTIVTGPPVTWTQWKPSQKDVVVAIEGFQLGMCRKAAKQDTDHSMFASRSLRSASLTSPMLTGTLNWGFAASPRGIERGRFERTEFDESLRANKENLTPPQLDFAFYSEPGIRCFSIKILAAVHAIWSKERVRVSVQHSAASELPFQISAQNLRISS